MGEEGIVRNGKRVLCVRRIARNFHKMAKNTWLCGVERFSICVYVCVCVLYASERHENSPKK